MRLLVTVCCWAALTAAGAAVAADDAVPSGPAATFAGAAGPEVEARWRDSFNLFATDDAAHPPPAGGVVFVGSSSIRLWRELESQFGGAGVIIKRGFGGSRLADCVRYLDRLVLQYRPRLVVVYAGDNDLAEGRTPAQVLESFVALTRAVEQSLPQAQVAYLSIKPSPLRHLLLPRVREANERVRRFIQDHRGGQLSGRPALAYIDVFSAMVDPAGAPREDLYLPDQLHLNAQGYAVWQQAIAPYLMRQQPVVGSANGSRR